MSVLFVCETAIEAVDGNLELQSLRVRSPRYMNKMGRVMPGLIHRYVGKSQLDLRLVGLDI